MVLSREDYDLVELRQIRKEVVYTRPFRRSPAVLTLYELHYVDAKIDTRDTRLTSQVEPIRRSSNDTSKV